MRYIWISKFLKIKTEINENRKQIRNKFRSEAKSQNDISKSKRHLKIQTKSQSPETKSKIQKTKSKIQKAKRNPKSKIRSQKTKDETQIEIQTKRRTAKSQIWKTKFWNSDLKIWDLNLKKKMNLENEIRIWEINDKMSFEINSKYQILKQFKAKF